MEQQNQPEDDLYEYTDVAECPRERAVALVIKSTDDPSSLKRELLNAKVELRNKEMQILDMQIKLDNLRKHKSNVDAAVATAVGTTKDEYEAALNQVTARLNAFQGATPQEVTQLRLQNAALISEKGDVEQRLTTAKEQLESLAQEARLMMGEWDAERAALQRDNDDLSQRLAKYHTRRETISKENESLKAKIAVLEDKIAAENPEVHHLQLKLTSAEHRAVEAESQCQQQQIAIDLLTAQLAASNTSLKQRDTQVEQLEDQIHSLQGVVEEQQTTIEELEDQLAHQTAETEEAQLQAATLTNDRNTWKEKAQESELKAERAVECAKEAASATVRMAERRVQQAEHRATEATQRQQQTALKLVDMQSRLEERQEQSQLIMELRQALSAQVAESALLKERVRKQSVAVEAAHRLKQLQLESASNGGIESADDFAIPALR